MTPNSRDADQQLFWEVWSTTLGVSNPHERSELLALLFDYHPWFSLFFVKPDIPLDLLREVYLLT